MRNVIRKHKWGRYFLKYPYPYRFYGVEEYKKWLTMIYFNVKKIGVFSKDLLFENNMDFISWIWDTWLPYINRLPEELRDQFVEEIAENYSETASLDGDATTTVKIVVLEVEAMK